MNLVEFNNATLQEAYDHMMKCCTSTSWCKQIAAARPFASKDEIYQKAREIWDICGEGDFLEAFQGHPKIGDINSLKEKYKNTQTNASQEQSGVDTASEEVIKELAKLNKEYEDKFGFIFIVCATGKSAKEMLEILKQRLPNTKNKEIEIAAAEQAKITQIRLEKLL